MSTVIVIPARLDSKRFPGKPLVNIAGKTMIARMINIAEESSIGPVIVACCEKEVKDEAVALGVEAVMTDKNLPSGSDRVFAAINDIEMKTNEKYDTIINLQCDLPFLPYKYIRILNDTMQSRGSQIATLAAEIKNTNEKNNANVVKVVFSTYPSQNKKALYFSRMPVPSGEGPMYHHIGIYAYKRQALEKFVSLKPSNLELRERLEQLRAIEAGLNIDIAIVDDVPDTVDTPDDLLDILKQLED